MEDYRDEVEQHLLNARRLILKAKYYDSSGRHDKFLELLYFTEANLDAANRALNHIKWEKANESKR